MPGFYYEPPTLLRIKFTVSNSTNKTYLNSSISLIFIKNKLCFKFTITGLLNFSILYYEVYTI